MRFNNLNFLFACFIFILFQSCDNNRFYEYNYPIENEKWSAENRLLFSLNIDDTLAKYNMFLNLRHTATYPFSNFFVFMYTQTPENVTYKDTIECTLSSAEGRWYGKVAGALVDNRIWIKTNQKFPKSGEYKIYLEHAMRTKVINNISDVGLRIEKMKN